MADITRRGLMLVLSSPSGAGVAVDADGRAVGGVSATDVLAALDRQRRS